MEPSKIDRRIKYAKKLLTDALASLLQHQHISSVSVKELCELADINRSTFYTHYRDPSDLLSQIEAQVYENVKRHIEMQEYKQGSLPVSQQMLTSVLEYIRENMELFKALLSENCVYFPEGHHRVRPNHFFQARYGNRYQNDGVSACLRHRRLYQPVTEMAEGWRN